MGKWLLLSAGAALVLMATGAGMVQSPEDVAALSSLSVAEARTKATATAAAISLETGIAEVRATATISAIESQQRQTLAEEVRGETRAAALSSAVSIAIWGAVALFLYAGFRFAGAEADRRRVIETRAGTLLLHAEGGHMRGQILEGRLVDYETPTEALPAPAMAEVIEAAPSLSDGDARTDAMRLLRHSLQRLGDGPQIGGYRRLGWASSAWQRAVRRLVAAGLAETGRGGTFVRQYSSCADLYAAIGERRATLPSAEGTPEATARG